MFVHTLSHKHTAAKEKGKRAKEMEIPLSKSNIKQKHIEKARITFQTGEIEKHEKSSTTAIYHTINASFPDTLILYLAAITK